MKNIFNSISDKLTYWNGGFYSNKSDSRLLVPKSMPGMGWRLNFGNPKAVKLFIFFMLVVVGIVIVLSLIFGVNSHY